jgi:signal transduction histidine kinase
MNSGREGTVPSRALDELDAIRRRVVNVVGHALRTPLTTMVGMATALRETDDEATRATLVEGLARNAARVERLLDDLLLAAGVDTAMPVGDPAPVPVHATVEAEWRELGATSELTVSGPELTVRTRPGAFERIAGALLDNAAKYGDTPVAVSTTALATVVRIEIVSTGEMPLDAELENAFELFYRGEHAVMASAGLGIGLPVARELARAEGGDVNLERRGNAIVAIVDLPG